MVIFYSIINPAKDLSKAVYSVQKGLASMERIDKILSADNPIKTLPSQRPCRRRISTSVMTECASAMVRIG